MMSDARDYSESRCADASVRIGTRRPGGGFPPAHVARDGHGIDAVDEEVADA